MVDGQQLQSGLAHPINQQQPHPLTIAGTGTRGHPLAALPEDAGRLPGLHQLQGPGEIGPVVHQ